jgi:hypothetical protein
LRLPGLALASPLALAVGEKIRGNEHAEDSGEAQELGHGQTIDQVRSWKPEVRRAKDRGQRTEGRGQRAEGKGQKFE